MPKLHVMMSLLPQKSCRLISGCCICIWGNALFWSIAQSNNVLDNATPCGIQNCCLKGHQDTDVYVRQRHTIVKSKL
jgi:hypothetical protein